MRQTLVIFLALSISSAQAGESCSFFLSSSLSARRQTTWQLPGGEFNASVNQRFYFISESQKGWGSGEGGVRGVGIRRLIHDLFVNTLTLRLWCFVFVALRLLFVRVNHLWPSRLVLQAGPKIGHLYFNSRSAWEKDAVRHLVTSFFAALCCIYCHLIVFVAIIFISMGI